MSKPYHDIFDRKRLVKGAIDPSSPQSIGQIISAVFERHAIHVGDDELVDVLFFQQLESWYWVYKSDNARQLKMAFRVISFDIPNMAVDVEYTSPMCGATSIERWFWSEEFGWFDVDGIDVLDKLSLFRDRWDENGTSPVDEHDGPTFLPTEDENGTSPVDEHDGPTFLPTEDEPLFVVDETCTCDQDDAHLEVMEAISHVQATVSVIENMLRTSHVAMEADKFNMLVERANMLEALLRK